MKSSDILDTIRMKHSEDLVIPQCKSGPSWGNKNLKIMDAWVMIKSWTQLNFIGYEIKVDRSDFISDNKWPGYLPYCNSFYFVCPKDVIKESELPAEAGLYYVATTLNRMVLKKKAPHRDVKIPSELFTYVLMCRTKIVADGRDKDTSKDYWKNWLEEKQLGWDIGHKVSKNLKRMIEEKIEKVDSENRDLKYEIERFQSIQEVLKEFGFEDGKMSYGLVNQLRCKLDELKRGCPDGLLESLNQAITNLTKARDILRKG